MERPAVTQRMQHTEHGSKAEPQEQLCHDLSTGESR